ncbi:hypothetical protein P152DRAFT_496222 [Eremomyces bilateralis CBS 781.70]|uniref:L domain-like protein n=1 Tax=Eremomyces bilateralis CBS 781.70 TaxID=1392243 RepID=A0A6G1GCI2_9PEZI|nr:uncharacterized protein P152DRAFT_496222 [Eremomyces bilateralis CBS 781.70]KAF1815611.1 hypothetical protein P152DRAFT_496222 [Eremomyces bilateralis CBS 781.70]
MNTEDGQIFIKNLASFVRTHEKALANALQLQRNQRPHGSSSQATGSMPVMPTTPQSSSASLASALSLPYLSFTSYNLKPAKLTLTPHHLFYLLSRFEELGVQVGPMNVRLENIHTDVSPTNYVSFLNQAQRKKSRGPSDRDSIHSVSSMRSVMSGMSSFWSSLGFRKDSKSEKQKAAIKEDLRYLYSAFTKIPCLRLSPDHKAPLIAGYEEFPFDSAVPLFAFKNLGALEIYDVDFRQFYGWDRLAEQLRSLTVKRGGVDDPADLLINIVLDDMDRRRRRSAKGQSSPVLPVPGSSPALKSAELHKQGSTPNSLGSETALAVASPQRESIGRTGSTGSTISQRTARPRQRSVSPMRGGHSSRPTSSNFGRNSTATLRRSSGSSGSSLPSGTPRGSSTNLLSLNYFPSTKWRFLRHLSLADNGMTSLNAASFAPVANTLQSLDLSSNLFTEIPDALSSLVALRALNLSNCMIGSLHSLLRNPLPAISTLNLRGNRLRSLAGIERLLSLQRVDFRDNKLSDPTELARLTGVPEIQELFVNRNPFTRTHSNYRVTIFNLFRATPGFIEDIIIDSTLPSYSERKQLVDRAPLPPNLPVKRVEAETIRPLEMPETPTRRSSKYAHGRTRSDGQLLSSGSHRRRKGTRRRIVELSRNEAGGMSETLPIPTESSSRVATDAPHDPSQPPNISSIDSAYGGSPDLSTSPLPLRSHGTPAASSNVDNDPLTDSTNPATTSKADRPALPALDTFVQTPPRTQPSSQPPPPTNPPRLLAASPPIPPQPQQQPQSQSQPQPQPQLQQQPPQPPQQSPQSQPSPHHSLPTDDPSSAYRRKISALRADLGPGWLSALSDDTWDSETHNKPASTKPPEAGPATTGRGSGSSSANRSLSNSGTLSMSTGGVMPADVAAGHGGMEGMGIVGVGGRTLG